jgi:hypothetical protein
MFEVCEVCPQFLIKNKIFSYICEETMLLKYKFIICSFKGNYFPFLTILLISLL